MFVDFEDDPIDIEYFIFKDRQVVAYLEFDIRLKNLLSLYEPSDIRSI